MKETDKSDRKRDARSDSGGQDDINDNNNGNRVPAAHAAADLANDSDRRRSGTDHLPRNSTADRTHRNSTGALPVRNPKSKRNSRLGTSNTNASSGANAHGARSKARLTAVGSVELPVIDTKNIRRANVGGSLSVPQSPTSGPVTAHSAGLFIARHPSIPQMASDLASLRQLQHTATGGSGYVKSGRMTKVPHYGRLRSVTARVLRMMDPRTLANQYRRQQQKQQAEENAAAGVQVDDGAHGNTAAGVLGLSFVDTMRSAAVRRRRRHSHG
ncbi:hypothetical protein LPJ75_006813, partial [Coemansia sp. RSA 2598]